MPKAIENLIIFLFGGAVYSLIEVVFRGYTHWSMTVTGGICLVLMYRRFTARPDDPLMMKCLFGAVTITSLEFAAGCIVNLWLDWHVWDYSGMMFNLYGQICPLFSALWFLLTVPVVSLTGFFSRRFAMLNGERPAVRPAVPALTRLSPDGEISFVPKRSGR
ncbi:MAG: putative ABC transporter permease [Oscillospiraceae bacterium]|nr:putative ABC transporter permease [Oscillospiraceae bacterium]